MTPQVRNVTSFGSCQVCDDTGLMVDDKARVWRGTVYPHWCIPCVYCEAGSEKRLRLSRRRDNWRDREVAA
jgi:hypothetical protein